MPVKGELWLDDGAVAAVRDQKKSLFAAGILKITGDFAAQDAVVLCDSNGYEFARGLCNYTQADVQKVQVSCPSSCFTVCDAALLGMTLPGACVTRTESAGEAFHMRLCCLRFWPQWL